MKAKLLALSFLLGSLVSFALFGVSGLVIFVLIWLDRIAIPLTQVILPLPVFGVELATLACILFATIAKNPVLSFFFSFLAYPLFAGLLDLIRYQFIPPLDLEWPPLLPRKGDFIGGVANYLACLLWLASRNFVATLIFGSFVYNCLSAILDKLTREEGQVDPRRALNFAFNSIVALTVGNWIALLVIG